MKQPNILLISSDQQHWNTIGTLNPYLVTPNLDRLAKEGITFTRAYCANPSCTPSRASLITGLYPSQHGAWTLGAKLPEDIPTLGGILAAAGYRTSLIGKAHFQPLRATDDYPSLESYGYLQDWDFWRNFSQDFYGFGHVELARNHTNEQIVGQHYALWMEENGLTNWRDYFRPPAGTMDPAERGTWPLPEEYHYDAWIAKRTNALLEQFAKDDANFFLWASFPDPHPPYLVPEPWDRMYDPQQISVPRAKPGEHATNPPHHRLTQERQPDFSHYCESGFDLLGMSSHVHDEEDLRKDIATYYGMISMMDKYIGSILDKLDELGLSENTIVVFTSDHGHLFGQHGLIAKGPFHYEDLLRVPLIVRYPGHAPARAMSGALQSLVDFAPTLLSLLGLPTARHMTGVDQSAVWLGGEIPARDHIICENHHEPTTIHLKTYEENRYKLTVYFRQIYGELFDLQDDPGELHNLWDDPRYRELREELLLKFLWAEFGKESVWMPRISHA